MKKVFKKINKKFIFGFILGALIFGTIGVSAATYYASKDVSYDNASSGMSSDNVQDAIDELYQIANTKPAIDKVTELVSTNTNELYTDEHGDIRYYGSNPNNYVTFNNELWRIIGVIDGKTKIIRDESIGNMAWASNGSNNWNSSSLKTYLNGTYYNSINEISRNMISEETYYLGGATSSNYKTLTASGYYNSERDSSQVYNGNPASTTQHIGLMYPSDYGYAAGSLSSTTDALITCDMSCPVSYLLENYEWTQTPYADSSNYATYINGKGYVGISNVTTSVPFYFIIRPVLYLNSNVKITGGDGSKSSPFTLSQ